MMANTFEKQRIIISLNGWEIQTRETNGEELKLIELDLPPGALGETNTLTFTLPDARSPASLGNSLDKRILGMGIAWLELVPTP